MVVEGFRKIIGFQPQILFGIPGQIEQPTRGGWASTCLNDLKEVRIEESFEEIKQMTKSKYSNMLKHRINENAIKYLIEKHGGKGKEIIYLSTTMADYLFPNNNLSNLEPKNLCD
jgi:nitrogenase molybdenum-iron protein alpha/beta subunit